MSDLLILGGRQRNAGTNLNEWNHYDKALALRIFDDGSAAKSVIEYETPPQYCPDEFPSIVFKAGTISNGLLYACTQTEVLIYNADTFELMSHITHPCFNDIHHVTPTPKGTMLVAVTGLDMVVEITHNGDIVNEWDVLGESLWTRFSRDTDYRKVQTTKPHKSHPNFLFILDGEYWVLRHAQRDAISLKNPDKKINIQVQRPHDGLEYEDRIYFTTVDGHIVAADKTTSEIVQIVNLNEFSDSDRPLGWCRGIHIIDKDTIIIGFSRLRPTAIMESVQWAKRKLKNALNIENDDSLPTRLCCYDLAKNIVLWEIDLENSGMNAIFSIHELS